jgi:hypothetical protein
MAIAKWPLGLFLDANTLYLKTDKAGDGKAAAALAELIPGVQAHPVVDGPTRAPIEPEDDGA